MNKYLLPRHYCWWCKDLREEGDAMHHYKSGWLCDTCKSYLEAQTGDKEISDED